MKATIKKTKEKCEVLSFLIDSEQHTLYVVRKEDKGALVSLKVMYPHEITFATRVAGSMLGDQMPCTVADFDAMHQFGYLWRGMLPISQDMAADLFSEGVTVYFLYSDGSEAEVTNVIHDILPDDAPVEFYGITVEDWLIHCGRIRDGEVYDWEIADGEKEMRMLVTTFDKYRGVTIDTNEEIEGYLVCCDSDGLVNPGKVYICPGVTYATMEGCRDRNGMPSYAYGPFVEVVADSVVPASIVSDELMAYRRTGLKPSEIQEAVDLFKDANASVPDEIIGWVQRASFHARKCAEMEKKIEELEQRLTGFQVREAKTLKEQMVERLTAESQHAIAVIFSEADGSEAAVKNVAITRAMEIALNEAIVSVFIGSDLQYCQLRVLDAVLPNELLSTIKKHLPKERACYGENEIKDAIFDTVAEVSS